MNSDGEIRIRQIKIASLYNCIIQHEVFSNSFDSNLS